MTRIEGQPKARDIARQSWKSLRAAFGARPLLFLVTLLLGAAWGVAALRIAPLKTALTAPKFDDFSAAVIAAHVGAKIVLVLFWSALMAPLAAAIHRLVLLNERGAEFPYRRFETRNLFYWLVGLLLAFVAARSFCLLLGAVAFVRGLSELTINIAALVVALQIGLIFPAIAIGVPAGSAEKRIDSGFRMTEGHFLLVLRTILLTLIPLIIAMVVLSRVAGGPPPPKLVPGAPPLEPMAPKMLQLIAAGLLGAVRVTAVALVAATLSWLYAARRKDA